MSVHIKIAFPRRVHELETQLISETILWLAMLLLEITVARPATEYHWIMFRSSATL